MRDGKRDNGSRNPSAIKTMADLSRVLCVLALLFVSAYADELSDQIFDFINDAKRNEDKTSSKFHTEVTLRNNEKVAKGKPNRAATGKNNEAPAWKQNNAPVQKGFNGKWELVSSNSGVSAMHVILLPKINKVLMYDATVWRSSKIALPPEKMPCRVVDGFKKEYDCWAHSLLFDIFTSQLKPLKIQTDTWCSSGSLAVDGHLVSTGGYGSGANTARYLWTCDTCDWKEYPTALAEGRWYSTQVTLPDGGFIVVGGRNSFSYEYIPPEGTSNKKANYLPLLRETFTSLRGLGDANNFTLENNLYPFVHLSTDGNVFIFANNRSILLNPATNKVIREFPILSGGPRSYPASGMSVILPIKLYPENPKVIPAEVLVCGGAEYDAYYKGETKKPLPSALKDCGRIQITSNNPVWVKEDMPGPRVMGDIMILPSGEVLMVNGAKRGSSGWNDADVPNFVPYLYNPNAPLGQRFKELAAGTIPRMYHSTAAVLPDGKVLIAGSNTNDGYKFDVKYPTELRVEKFSPPYLDPSLDSLRQHIVVEASDQTSRYGYKFSVKVKSQQPSLDKDDLMVTMYAPPFTTHGISMNQRLIILGISEVINNIWAGAHNIIAVAPPSGAIAPPGYYLLSVIYKGAPSTSMWFQVK